LFKKKKIDVQTSHTAAEGVILSLFTSNEDKMILSAAVTA